MHITAQQFGVSGHVHVKKIGSNGRVNFESEFTNLVLDTFFNPFIPNSMASENLGNATNTIFLGADVQTPPQPTDTAMANQIAMKLLSVFTSQPNPSAAFVSGPSIEEDYLTFYRIAEFMENEAIGNLTEVGLGSSYSVGTNQPRVLFRSLIKDNQGIPVAVNKTDQERLIVAYEFRIYRPPLLSISDPFNINGEMFRFASTLLFDEQWLLQNIPATDWDFEAARGLRTAMRADTFAATTGTGAFSYTDTTAGFAIGPNSGSRELILPPVPEERFLHPVLVVRGPASRDLSTEVVNTVNAYSNTSIGAMFCRRWSTAPTSILPIMGITVDANSLVPKNITLPANHRLKFTTNPDHLPLVSRRV